MRYQTPNPPVNPSDPRASGTLGNPVGFPFDDPYSASLTARRCRCAVKFPGSGGAVLGLCRAEAPPNLSSSASRAVHCFCFLLCFLQPADFKTVARACFLGFNVDISKYFFEGLLGFFIKRVGSPLRHRDNKGTDVCFGRHVDSCLGSFSAWQILANLIGSRLFEACHDTRQSH